jgi:outer membrane protein OmpA-like peptidoglycan-associated protein
MRHEFKSVFATCCLAVVAAGCSSSKSQLATVQADKEQLLATIREQRDTTRTLHDQVASLETRLDQAEKELARRGGGTRISSRPEQPTAPVQNESLPWRNPPTGKNATPAKSSSGPAIGDGGRNSNARSAVGGVSLASLASRDRRLLYDTQSHAARFDTPIAFDDNTAALSAQGKRQLDEVARFLKSEPARDLRVMVAGYAEGRPSTTAPAADGESRPASARQLGAARAQAVADYLDRHGIAQERLGITGVGNHGIQDDVAKNSGGVQIYLLQPDAAVVGWGPTGESLRR